VECTEATAETTSFQSWKCNLEKKETKKRAAGVQVREKRGEISPWTGSAVRGTLGLNLTVERGLGRS